MVQIKSNLTNLFKSIEINDNDILLETFQNYDVEGKGFFDIGKFREILSLIGEGLSNEEIEEMLKEAKMENSNLINYKEFIKIMTMK